MAHVNSSTPQLEYSIGDGNVEKSGEIRKIDEISDRTAFATVSGSGRDAASDGLDPHHFDY